MTDESTTARLIELVKQWRSAADWMMGSTNQDDWQRGASGYLRQCANELEIVLRESAPSSSKAFNSEGTPMLSGVSGTGECTRAPVILNLDHLNETLRESAPTVSPPPRTVVERLNAALVFMETLQAEGIYLHDTKGHALNREAFIGAITRALDVLIAAPPTEEP